MDKLYIICIIIVYSIISFIMISTPIKEIRADILKKKKRVIFVDVDSIVTTSSDKSTLDNYYYYLGINEDKVRLLYNIHKKTGANIVLTSTWRADFISNLQVEMHPIGYPAKRYALDIMMMEVGGKSFKVYDVTPKIKPVYRYADSKIPIEEGLSIDTSDSNIEVEPTTGRTGEIMAWLETHMNSINSYVILDSTPEAKRFGLLSSRYVSLTQPAKEKDIIKDIKKKFNK